MLSLRVGLLLVSCSLSLGIVEVVLRYQTVVELRGLEKMRGFPSSVLHHHAKDSSQDSDARRHTWGDCDGSRPPVRLTFFGDSWFEQPLDLPIGEKLSESLPGECIVGTNGGVSSYSPSLYLLKANALAVTTPSDFVFVNVDSTDIGDEWFRYRIPSVRSRDDGSLVAVPFTNDIVQNAWLTGIVESGEHDLYLLRLMHKIYHTRVFMPRLRELSGVGDSYQQIMGVHWSRQPRKEHRDEVRYFEASVREMLRGLIRQSAPDRVFLLYHPHLPAISSGCVTDGTPERYNCILREVLVEVAESLGVSLIDATDAVEEIHGGDVAAAFQWPEDPFSHLRLEGVKNYGRFVARRAAPKIAAWLSTRRLGGEVIGTQPATETVDDVRSSDPHP